MLVGEREDAFDDAGGDDRTVVVADDTVVIAPVLVGKLADADDMAVVAVGLGEGVDGEE